ncbi:MAG: hypothetical protein ACLGIR_10675 [Actinomycetes bacterium]
MSALEVRLPRQVVWPAVLLATGGVVGLFASGVRGSDTLLGAGIALAFFALGVANWRLSAAALAVYTVFAGFVTIATYPATATASLAKDLLFVAPIYVGLLADPEARRSVRMLWDEHRWVGRCVIAFVAVVVLQVFNPSLPSIVVGLVGLRVWALYLPFLLVGFTLARQGRAMSTLRYLAAVSTLPLLIGVAQAALMRAGQADLATFWYGEAGPAITQRFATFEIGGGVITRVASTLPHTAQYFALTMAGTAVGLALVSADARRSPAHRAFLGLAVVAGLLSGARGALFSVPLLVAIFLLVPGRRRAGSEAGGPRRAGSRAGIAALAALGLVVGSAVLRIDTVETVTYLGEVASAEFTDLVIDGTSEALDATTLGLGAGSNTNAARYVSAEGTLVVDRWLESWYVKALVELGVVGLVVQVALVLSLMLALLGVARRGSAPRGLVAAAVALIGWTALYAVKGGFMDTEPMNLLFWFVPGLALGAAPPPTVGDR